MIKLYEIELCFKVPNDQGRLLDLRSKVFDILYAVEEFNCTEFKDYKKIFLKNILRKRIQLLLYIDKHNGSNQVTARDISVFSKRLYHDKNWSIFTKENAKLFVTLKFEECLNTTNYKFDGITFFSQEIIDIKKKYPQNNSNIDIFNSHILSDRDLLTWTEMLISMQEVGSEFEIERKKKIIYQLKEIIKNSSS